jgi:phosphodiesterase/alkaline phosphatase D-like protein
VAAPLLRDVHLTVPRSGAAGSQGAVQEASVSCYTGRHATSCTVVAEYGPTTAYGSTTSPSPPGGAHTVQLGDLTPGAYYHFRVKATDPTDAANPTYSQDYTWTQPPDVVPPGPVVVVTATTGITTTGATVNWTTSPACPSGQVNYSTSPTLTPLSVKSETGGTVTSHSAALTGLTAATRYWYRVFQVAPNGSSRLSSLQSFVTS